VLRPFRAQSSFVTATQGFTLGYHISPLRGAATQGFTLGYHISPLRGAATQGFTLGYHISPLRGCTFLRVISPSGVLSDSDVCGRARFRV